MSDMTELKERLAKIANGDLMIKNEANGMITKEEDTIQSLMGHIDALGDTIKRQDERITKYKKAFQIACELLNGSILYGYDTDRIFEEMIEKDGYVVSGSYEVFILNNLDRLSGGAEMEDK